MSRALALARIGCFLFLASMVVIGCGGTDDRDPTTAAQSLAIETFAVQPASILEGESATISWTTRRADTILIQEVGGAPVDLGGAAVAEGSIEVSPSATTRYEIIATSAGGATATRSLSLEVRAGHPKVEFWVDAERIDFGSSALLQWTTEDANWVQITSGGSSLFHEESPSGSLKVSPEKATTYQLKAQGAGGEETASLRVEVAPVVSGFAADSQVAKPVGASVRLTWTTAGAETVHLSSEDGYEYAVPREQRARGNVTTVLGASGVFHLTVVREGIEVVRELVLPILEAPVVEAFTAAPSAVTLSDDEPGRVVIAWQTRNASVVSLLADPGGSIPLVDVSPIAGSIELEILGDTTYVLSATHPATTTVTAELQVKTFGPPSIDSFSASPPRAGVGEEVLLSWTTTNAARIEIERGGQPLSVDPASYNASFSTPLNGTSTFVLRAINGAGLATEASVEVTAGAPSILSFEPSVVGVRAGEPLEFSWSVLGGVALEVLGPDGAIPGCSTSDQNIIAAGSCATVAPPTPGETEFQLAVTNGVGDRSVLSAMVGIRGGPMIRSFTAAERRISIGDSLDFEWSVDPDIFGVAASLSIQDDLGHTFPITDPALGTVTIDPSGIGDRTYTLFASTPGTDGDSRPVSVQILVLPTISLSANASAYVPSSGIPVTLSWQTSDATSVVIYRVNAVGQILQPAFFTALSHQVSSGTAQARPVGDTVYRAVATNAAGGSTYDEVSIEAPAFQIVSFNATPDVISRGSSSVLSWETVGAVSIDLDVPNTYSVSPATEPYLDISASPTKLTTPTNNCGSSWDDEGCPLITFPAGFTFPYFGVTRSQAKIYINGFISFDLTRTGSNFTTSSLPSTSNAYVHLAPLWRDLHAPSPDNVMYDVGMDARGQYMVVQWAGFGTGSPPSSGPPGGPLNFQLVMWEDGAFDFRYATMGSLGSGSASIGYQNTAGNQGHQVSYNATIPNIDNSGYSFRLPDLSSNGTAIVSPTSTRTYTLVATDIGGAQLSETISVTVNP